MRLSKDFHKSQQNKYNRNMQGPCWNKYERNTWQPGWLTEREERRTPGCWKFSGYNLQKGARQIRSNYDGGNDLGVMVYDYDISLVDCDSPGGILHTVAGCQP